MYLVFLGGGRGGVVSMAWFLLLSHEQKVGRDIVPWTFGRDRLSGVRRGNERGAGRLVW
jgi:hypothetical protein